MLIGPIPTPLGCAKTFKPTIMNQNRTPVKAFLLFDDKDFDAVQEIEKHCAGLVHEKKIEVWHHKNTV